MVGVDVDGAVFHAGGIDINMLSVLYNPGWDSGQVGGALRPRDLIGAASRAISHHQHDVILVGQSSGLGAPALRRASRCWLRRRRRWPLRDLSQPVSSASTIPSSLAALTC